MEIFEKYIPWMYITGSFGLEIALSGRGVLHKLFYIFVYSNV